MSTRGPAIVMCAGAMLIATAARAVTLADGWRALAGYRADDAAAIFARLAQAPDTATAREASFGGAVALLVKQPTSDAQTLAAQRRFAELAESGRDDVGLGARFYLARIAQHHLSTPDNAAAARAYRELIQADADSRWAQAALSRYAMLQLYALDETQPPEERVNHVEKLVPLAKTPAAQCDLHRAIADAVFQFRLPPQRALPHLLAAEKLNRMDAVARADVLVQIAELSRAAGDTARAREFYAKLLHEFPRDQRHTMVRQRLEALGGEAGRPTDATADGHE